MLTALHFATREPANENGVIWQFSSWLNTSFEPPNLSGMRDLELFPARHSAARIGAQSAMFSWHELPSGRKDFVPLEKRDPQQRFALKKFVVPKDRKLELRLALLKMGVHEFSLFPDLDGLARHLSDLVGLQHHTGDPIIEDDDE